MSSDAPTARTPTNAAPAKSAWVTPRIEQIGHLDEVMSGGAQPPNDSSGAPSVAAS